MICNLWTFRCKLIILFRVKMLQRLKIISFYFKGSKVFLNKSELEEIKKEKRWLSSSGFLPLKIIKQTFVQQKLLEKVKTKLHMENKVSFVFFSDRSGSLNVWV